MHRPLSVLIIEDSEDDAILEMRELKKGGYAPEYKRVETADAMQEALKEKAWDVILCDYQLPAFCSMEAIALLRKTDLDIPLIIVSGVIGEETAVNCMRDGAQDYIMKDHLARLCPTIERELKEKDQRIKQKLAEENRQASDVRFKALFENMKRCVAVYEGVNQDEGSDFIIRDFNKAAEQAENICKEKIVNRSIKEVFPGVERMGLWDVLMRVWQTGRPEQLTASFYQDDQRQGWRENYVYKLPTGEVVAIYEDITDRLNAEAALRNSRETFAKIFKANPAAIAISLIKNGRIMDVNVSFEKMFGYTAEELTGHTILELNFISDTDEYQAVADTILRNGFIKDHEIGVRAKNGQELIISYTAEIIELQGEACLLSIIVDVTASKKAEEEQRKLEKLLYEAQKMESIGTLAGGIAHDFNNILSGIIGYAELAARTHDAAVRKKHLDKILATAERAKHLVTQILAFSRHVEHSKTQVDIKHIVKDALGLLRSTIPANIDIRRNMPDFPLVVYGDATQMHQVIMNICTNALHAMGQKGGVLEVNLTREDIAHEYLSETINLKPGVYVKLSIADTGQGIDPSIMNRLFDPFFTTKRIGEGTGLGLSVVYGIVKDHDGGINVSSVPGEGATFEVYLPYIEERAPTEKPSVDETPPGGTEHILFVDDEQALVDLARENLQDMGYRVSAFSDSRQALNTYLKNPNAFDLLITDMTMPYLSGSDLSEAILGIRPQQPIILYTGFSDYMDDEKAAQLGVKAFLLKPLNRRSLALAIRKVLDK